ncbi:MAG TPA: hypothetical protein VIG66_01500 [Noviherbaspirillum sp.]
MHKLRDTLAAHAEIHGASWSEHDAVCGSETDRRTGLHPGREALGAPGARMYRLLKNLPLNGYERSFKFLPGRLLTERFLLGIHRERLGQQQLLEILDGLDVPDEFRTRFMADLPRTRFLHFGHEAGSEGVVRKVYQEYEQAEGTSGSGSLLYTGYKWDPEQPQRRALSHYRLLRGLTLEQMLKRVTSLHADRHTLAAAARTIVTAAGTRCPATSLLYLDVSEEDNPRLSCDINLYAADMALHELAPLLEQAAACFGIAPAILDAYLATLPGAKLGHVSTGCGRDGLPFLTIYYARAV